jgi:polyisoprenoid-binding protein YceI
MKLLLMFIFSLTLGISPNDTSGDTYTADITKSAIKWTGQKVTGKHYGSVPLANGALEFADGQLTGGSFEIDMANLVVEDLEGKSKGKLEGHLKSADFFGVEAHPSAMFKITKVVSGETPGDYAITGDMTIKGITKAIEFSAQVEESGEELIAKAAFEVDRTAFDIRYGSGSFFDNLGDRAINDDFELEIMLVTKK